LKSSFEKKNISEHLDTVDFRIPITSIGRLPMRESLSAFHISPWQVFMAGQNWGDNLAGRTVWLLFQDSSCSPPWN
jgi:hypothetical protein